MARLTGKQGSYKSGYFRLLPGDSAVDVHNLLVSGYQEQVKVTIPEGWTLKKIAGHLEAKGVSTRAEVLAAASSRALLARSERAGREPGRLPLPGHLLLSPRLPGGGDRRTDGPQFLRSPAASWTRRPGS